MDPQRDIVFGPFRLDLRGRGLMRAGVPVPLGGRALDVLAVLAKAGGETVGKDALLDQVWPNLTVEENNLQVQISALRKVLGDGWITTLPGRGYRLASSQPEPGPGPGRTDKPTIAVMPFENMSDDPEQAYFADGMTEEVINALSRIRSFFVIARNSSFSYQGKSPDIGTVGRELGVRYVVEGSVRKGGDRVRISGRLADATTGAQLWSDHFDGAIENVFELQDRVAASLIGAIEPRIRAVEIETAQRKPPESLQAYDLVLRALPHVYSTDRIARAEADRLLRQAIEMAPTYALALALRSRCIWTTVAAGWLPDTGPARADVLRLAQLALANGGDDPEVLALASAGICTCGGDLPGAIALVEKALSLNPNSIEAINYAGLFYAYSGETAKVMGLVERAERLNPFAGDAVRNYIGALAHFVAGQHEKALPFAESALRALPHFIAVAALRYRTASLALLGRTAEARRSARDLLVLMPELTVTRARAHLEIDNSDAIRIPGVVDAFCEGLRRAGVPEE